MNSQTQKQQQPPPKVIYSSHKYDSDHWSINYRKAGTSLAHALFKNKYYYSIILNPTDCRCYRTIVRYLNNDANIDLQSALNRPYTIQEKKGLKEVTCVMEVIYQKLGLIPQYTQLGNNSHKFNEQKNQFYVGSEEQPGFLHLHLWGRGDPSYQYIEGVPLRGQKPGCMFGMVVKQENVTIPSPNVKWEQKQLREAITRFKKQLKQYITSNEYIDSFKQSLDIRVDE